jgi:hypothetical protein
MWADYIQYLLEQVGDNITEDPRFHARSTPYSHLTMDSEESESDVTAGLNVVPLHLDRSSQLQADGTPDINA